MRHQSYLEAIPSPSRQEQSLFIEQIRLLQEQSLPAVLLNLPLALVSALVFWDYVPQRLILPWTATVVLLSLLRLVLFRQFRRMEQNEDCVRRWAAIHLWTTAMTGASWGAMGFFLFQDLPNFQANYIILVFLGLTGTSIAVNASYLLNFLAFLLPAVLLMEVVLFSLDKTIYSGFNYLLLLYLLVLIKAAHT